jgi:hypothetical protein
MVFALNTPASVQLVATGSAGGDSFSIASGAFPVGVSMAAGGLITGTPTIPGAWNVTIQDHDSNGSQGLQAYSGTV